jgi:hypothetical protein
MEPRQFLNHTVASVVGVRETKGDRVGVELELEGRGVGLADIATRGWNRHHDGSLRGESIEFVTAGSKTFAEQKKLNTDLFKKFADNRVKFTDSIRTSTHVHLNYSDKLVKQAINFFSLFTMFEEVLQYYSGEDRKGNLFCISTREAEGIVGILSTGIAKGTLQAFAGDRYKYAACNLSTLFKFGTIEVRTMRGATSAEQVNLWLDILQDMHNYACNVMKSPGELITNLSHDGAIGLMRKIFSPKSYEELMRCFPKVATLHYSLMEGARMLQVFAYQYDDDFTAKIELPKIDPKAQLPKRIQEGRYTGLMYGIYKPNGVPWNCDNRGNNPHFWTDGEACIDDARIRWNAALQRFVYRDMAGRLTPCNWRIHPLIEDEGRPRGEIPLPEPEEDFDEPDWNDDIEDDDVEEDDF